MRSLPVVRVLRRGMLVAGIGLGIPVAAQAAADGVWSALAPTGVPPSAREGHSAIYDPVRDRMIVFGGYGSGPRNDVWALSLSGSPTWSALATAGDTPSPRGYHTAIYDPVRDRMIVFGGNSFTQLNDVSALSLSGTPTWSALAETGTPPSPRYWHSAIYDPERDRMVVFGGYIGSGNTNGGTWALSLGTTPAWSQLNPPGALPTHRQGHTAIYDPSGDRMVVFAGFSSLGGYLNDAWTLSLAGTPGWTALAPGGAPPSGRQQHTAIRDPVRDRMVVFGGRGSAPLNDAWELPLGGSPTWSPLAPSGGPPEWRSRHTAVYDPVRDRMIVFGGFSTVRLNDVWTLGWGPPLAAPGAGGAGAGRLALSPLRPNPSAGETRVDFELGESGPVVLEVFDARGRLVRRIADERLPAGFHTRTWRGDDDRGVAVGAGIYYVRVKSAELQATRRTARIN